MQLADRFDAAAASYDEVRPGYPERIIDAIVAFAQLPRGGRILEIGCGTGQITRPFARRGYALVAVEPGAALAALAARHCAPFASVEVACARFEAWRGEPASFDLVVSAQAFHWLDPDAGCARAAVLLRDGGAIALVWNSSAPSRHTAFWRATAPLYEAFSPGRAAGNAPLEDKIARCRAALCAARWFGPIEEARQGWSARYDAASYLQLLDTYSDHRALPEPDRTRFFEAIGRVIEDLGGEVVRRYEAIALMARRRVRASGAL